jgi:hypothetical protein
MIGGKPFAPSGVALEGVAAMRNRSHNPAVRVLSRSRQARTSDDADSHCSNRQSIPELGQMLIVARYISPFA